MIRTWMMLGIGLLPTSTGIVAPRATQELKEAMRAKPDQARGAELFKNCRVCHGRTGLGDPEGDVPAIAGQYFRVILKQLVDFRHAKRWDIRMERIADTHVLQGAQDIADVAAYVSALERTQLAGAGSGAWVDRGKEAYTRLCSACHGAAGEGSSSEGVPKLAGQHHAYLLRQMHDVVDGRRPNMSSEHRRLLKKLVMEDYEVIFAYAKQHECRLAFSGEDLEEARAVYS